MATMPGQPMMRQVDTSRQR